MNIQFRYSLRYAKKKKKCLLWHRMKLILIITSNMLKYKWDIGCCSRLVNCILNYCPSRCFISITKYWFYDYKDGLLEFGSLIIEIFHKFISFCPKIMWMSYKTSFLLSHWPYRRRWFCSSRSPTIQTFCKCLSLL